MNIANPIYDTVFKYLLDDNKVARLIISAIIGSEIEELELRPTETYVEKENTDGKESQIFFTVYRIDFSAKIQTPEGSKLVLIEIQKAKLPTDIIRFRKYLGANYADKNNMINDGHKTKALPIISIYFLGHRLEHTQAPVIKVNREYLDLATNKIITKEEEFIESLTHDSYIIQIPELQHKRRTDLECVLSVFDQDNQTNDDHILNINEEDLPEKYRVIIRRLLEAASNSNVRSLMDVEDEIMEGFKIQERKTEEALQLAEIAKAGEEEAKSREEEAKSRELQERKEKEEAKAREEEAKSRELQERKEKEDAKAREEEAKVRELQERKEKEASNMSLKIVINSLITSGQSIENIASMLNKTTYEIRTIID